MTGIKPAAFAAGWFAAAGLGLLVATNSAYAQHSIQDQVVARGAMVRQTTLLVEDIDRTMDFYLRLGLSKVSDRTFEDSDQNAVFSASDLPLTADPKTSRLVVMKSTAESGSMIGLLSYDHPRLSSARGNLGGLGTGDIIITVEVADIQDAYRRLGQVGTRFQRSPYRATIMNADGTRQPVMRMLAFDPDGHLAEVIQPDAGRK